MPAIGVTQRRYMRGMAKDELSTRARAGPIAGIVVLAASFVVATNLLGARDAMFGSATPAPRASASSRERVGVHARLAVPVERAEVAAALGAVVAAGRPISRRRRERAGAVSHQLRRDPVAREVDVRARALRHLRGR
jgi:hypothetical protein